MALNGIHQMTAFGPGTANANIYGHEHDVFLFFITSTVVLPRFLANSPMCPGLPGSFLPGLSLLSDSTLSHQRTASHGTGVLMARDGLILLEQ